MGRSLKVSPGCIEQVKSAVGRNGFPSQKALALELGISESTVKSFLWGKPVDYINFVEISERLGYEWKAIAHRDETIPKPVFEEPSAFITGTPITNPRPPGKLRSCAAPKPRPEINFRANSESQFKLTKDFD